MQEVDGMSVVTGQPRGHAVFFRSIRLIFIKIWEAQIHDLGTKSLLAYSDNVMLPALQFFWVTQEVKDTCMVNLQVFFFSKFVKLVKICRS